MELLAPVRKGLADKKCHSNVKFDQHFSNPGKTKT